MSINNDALKSVPRNVNVSRRVVSKRNKLIGPLPLGWRRKKEGHVVYWIGTRQPPFLGQITPPFDFIQRTQNWKSFSNESVRKEKAKEAPLFDRYHVVFGGKRWKRNSAQPPGERNIFVLFTEHERQIKKGERRTALSFSPAYSDSAGTARGSNIRICAHRSTRGTWKRKWDKPEFCNEFRKMALIMDAIELQSTYADNDRSTWYGQKAAAGTLADGTRIIVLHTPGSHRWKLDLVFKRQEGNQPDGDRWSALCWSRWTPALDYLMCAGLPQWQTFFSVLPYQKMLRWVSKAIPSSLSFLFIFLCDSCRLPRHWSDLILLFSAKVNNDLSIASFKLCQVLCFHANSRLIRADGVRILRFAAPSPSGAVFANDLDAAGCPIWHRNHGPCIVLPSRLLCSKRNEAETETSADSSAIYCQQAHRRSGQHLNFTNIRVLFYVRRDV